MPALIPQAVTRRLQLAMSGFRVEDGVWSNGAEVLTEEAVDTMPERRWRSLVQGRLVGGVHELNEVPQ